MIEWSFAFLDTFFICRNAVYWWGCLQSGGYGVEFGVKLLKRAAFAAGTCVFTFGGALVGGIAGAMEGQTTETGFFRGGAIGVISGAIVALELLDSTINGHFLSKVALASSILNGKAFREWVSPAVLKAYQWQISVVEDQENEITGIYDVAETRGMLVELIKRLPMIYFYHNQMPTSPNAVCCAICLQDLVDGESARILPSCEHLFHLNCIDEWLVRCASCPVCRQPVGSEE